MAATRVVRRTLLVVTAALGTVCSTLATSSQPPAWRKCPEGPASLFPEVSGEAPREPLPVRATVKWPAEWRLFGPFPKTGAPALEGRTSFPGVLTVNNTKYVARTLPRPGQQLEFGKATPRVRRQKRSAAAVGFAEFECISGGTLALEVAGDLRWFLDGVPVHPQATRSANRWLVLEGLTPGKHLLAFRVQGQGFDWRIRAAEVDKEAFEAWFARPDGLGGLGGVVSLVGNDLDALSARLADTRKYIVHWIVFDPEALHRARSAVRKTGCYGHVSVERFESLEHLPYADDFVNAVVVDVDAATGACPPEAELLRVLAPRGRAYVKRDGAWAVLGKPWPEDMDEWPYRRRGLDSNAASVDRVVAPPEAIRWVAGPQMAAARQDLACLTAGGRFFEMDRNVLIARDAFNGVPLWTGSGDRRLFFVDGDSIYTIQDGHPVALDAATGAVRKPYPNIAGDTLYPGSCRVGRHLLFPAKEDIVCLDADSGAVRWRHAYRDDAQAPEPAAESRPRSWWEIRPETGGYRSVDHVVMISDRERLYYVEAMKGESGRFALVALDVGSGAVQWRTPLNTYEDTVPDKSYASNARREVLRVVFVRDGIVVVAGRGGIQVLESGSGKHLWAYTYLSTGKHNTAYGSCFYIDGLVWVGAYGRREPRLVAAAPTQPARPPRREMFFRSYMVNNPGPSRQPDGADPPPFKGWVGMDPRTGEVVKGVRMGSALGARCAPDIATQDFFLHQHMQTTQFDGTFGWFTAYRPPCAMGPIVGNGLSYVQPNVCMCYRMMRGRAALCGRVDNLAQGRTVRPAERRDAGASSDSATKAADAEAVAAGAQRGEWPTYRHDARRTGFTPHALPDELQWAWSFPAACPAPRGLAMEYFLHRNPGFDWPSITPPAVGAGVAVAAFPHRHEVVAVDVESGTLRWRFTAGGRVPATPTLWRGLCLIGSNDGCVYAVRARDGREIWRYRLMPEARKIMVYGQLESPLPVQSGVLVAEDGLAYAVFGRHTGLEDGLRVAVLNPATGDCLAVHRVPDRQAEQRNPNTLTFHADWLSSDGRHVRLGDVTIPLSAGTGSPATAPLAFIRAASYTMVRSRAPTKVGRPEGLVVMAPQRQASLRGSKVTSAPLRSGDPAGETSAGPWTAGIDSRNPEAMFGAGERLYVAEGGRLHVMDLAGGNRRGSLALTLPGADGHDSPPLPRCVFDGFAVAYGRLFVSDADGRLHCFAAARAESRRGSGPDREHAGADPGTAAAGSRRRPDG